MAHLQWIFPLKIVIFHGHVSLPEGICPCMFHPNKTKLHNRGCQLSISSRIRTLRMRKEKDNTVLECLGSVQRTESDTAQKGVHANLMRKLSNNKNPLCITTRFFPRVLQSHLKAPCPCPGLYNGRAGRTPSHPAGTNPAPGEIDWMHNGCYWTWTHQILPKALKLVIEANRFGMV